MTTQPSLLDAASAPVEAEEFDLSIDPSALTMGDLIDFEQATGTSFDEIGGTTRDALGNKVDRKPSAVQLTALVWLSKRRTNPAYTFEDAKQVRISAFNTKASDNQDPSEPAA